MLLVPDKVSEVSEFLGIFSNKQNPVRPLRKTLLKLQKHDRLLNNSVLIGGIQSA